MPAPLGEEHLNDPVSRHMRRDVVALSVGQTVAEALASLRARPPEGRVVYFYVTDADGRLRGVVPTRRLLLSDPGRCLAEIMVERVVALPEDATVLDACEFFIQHRFLGFPVIDAERRLVGAVDVELYTEELGRLGEPERDRDDLFQLIGVHVAASRRAGPLVAFRDRLPWLACNVVGGVAAALLSGLYRGELERALALALFIPVVLSLSEAVSVQSVSLALEILHGRSPTWGTLLRRLPQELTTGLLLGAATGAAVAAVAWLWQGDARLALCLLLAIAGGVGAAAALGLTVPVLLRLLRREPRVAAGPVALTAADVLTLLVYLNLARWILG